MFLSSCGDDGACVDGSGLIVTDTRTIDSYVALNNSTSADIILDNSVSMGEIRVEGEDNIIPEFRTELDQESLIIETESGCIRTTASVEIGLNPSNLVDIVNSGSGNIDGAITSTRLQIINSGSGDFELTGELEFLEITNSGSGDIDLARDSSDSVEIVNSGSGDIYIRVTNSLSVNISGSGDVYYKGDPIIDQTISGSGELIDNN